MGCSINVEDRIGPEVDGSCLGGFDFTLLFEETFFSIAPLIIISVLLPIQFYRLGRRPQLIKVGWFLCAKLIFYAIAQFVTLILVLNGGNGVQKTRATLPEAAFSAIVAVLLVVLSAVEHLHSVRPSSLLTAYFGATAILDGVRTRTLYSIDDNQTYAIVFSVSSLLKVFIFFLEAWNKRARILEPYRTVPKETTLGLFSRNFFWWVNPLLWYGYRHEIRIDNLDPIDERIDSEDKHRAIYRKWQALNPKKPGSLVKLLISEYKWQILAAVPSRLALTGFTFAQPFLVTRVSSFVLEPNTPLTNDIGFGLIAATAIIYAGLALTTANSSHHTYRAITAFRGSLVTLLYSGTMPLTSSDVRSSSATTLMSADVERTGTGMRYMHEVWASPIDIGIGIWLLSQQLGVAAVIPGALFLVCSILAVRVAISMGTRQRKWLEGIEKRVNVTSDMLGSMKEVRMSGLQSKLKSDIENLRLEEMKKSKPFKNALIILVTLSYVTVALAPVISFGMFTLLAKARHTTSLNSKNAFTSLALFALIQQPMSVVINALGGLMTALGSLTRIGEYLCKQPRVDPRERIDSTAENSHDEKASIPTANIVPSRNVSDRTQMADVFADNMVEAAGVSVGWEKDKPLILNDLNFEIPRAGLTMVVGPVGCGKSTLLRAILGETTRNQGAVRVGFRHAGFCAQAPWIMNVTVKKNILGAYLFDRKWYNQVIDACMLRDDVSKWPNGDDEPVGNNGCNLSGGQQARLSVARAVYAQSDVVLLDDVMSGLDAGTEDQLFNNLFGPNGLFRTTDTTVIYATNGVHRLSYAQHIIVLDAKGNIAEQGPYDTLSPSIKQAQSAPPEYSEVAKPAATEAAKLPTAGPPKPSAVAGSDRRKGETAVYIYYARIVGWFNFAIFIAAICLFVFSLVFPQYLVKWWVEANEKQVDHDLGYYLGGYFALSLVAIIVLGASCWHFVNVMMARASKTLHEVLLNATLNAPQSFFGEVDVGETTNRFSQDLQLADMELPLSLFTTVVQAISVLAQFILIAVSAKFLGAALPLVAIVFYLIQKFYLRTGRQLRLLDIESKSPLFSMFIELLSGLVTIRAYGWQDEFDRRHLEVLGVSQRPNYLLYCIQRWLNLVLDFVVWAIAIVVVAIATKTKGSLDPSLVGIALINIINFGISIKQLILNYTTLEISIGAVNRVRTFVMDLETEHKPGETQKPSPAWPEKGAIDFRNVTATYKGKTKPVINNLNLPITPGQKIAICGPSGSGKSSTIACLLRLFDHSEGSIIIDGSDTQVLPREDIRSRIITVTQQPYLFAGTTRENLDPFQTCQTEHIIQAIKAVQMWEMVEELGGLDKPLKADVMSVGQKQLLCFARAMLRKGSILVLDEATASIDHDTDDLVQKIIRTYFKQHTVIAIAHRLNTVVDFDKVAVISAGQLVEFDTPSNLLAREHSIFKDLYSVSAAGAEARKDREPVSAVDEKRFEDDLYDLSAAMSSSVRMPGFQINSPVTPITPGGSWRQYNADLNRAMTIPEMIPEDVETDNEWDNDDEEEEHEEEEEEDDSDERPIIGRSGQSRRSHAYSQVRRGRPGSDETEEMQLWLKTQKNESFLKSKSTRRKGKGPARSGTLSGAPQLIVSGITETFGRLTGGFMDSPRGEKKESANNDEEAEGGLLQGGGGGLTREASLREKIADAFTVWNAYTPWSMAGGLDRTATVSQRRGGNLEVTRMDRGVSPSRFPSMRR